MIITRPGVFYPIPLVRQSFFARLFGRLAPENAFIEVNNTLAEAERPAFADATKILAVHRKYGSATFSWFITKSERLYSEYLRSLFSFSKPELSKEDRDDLQVIRMAFLLPDDCVNRINLDVGRTIYRAFLSRALSDGMLTDEEKRELENLGEELNLDKETIHELYAAELSKLIEEKVEDALEDGELTPEEERHIQELCDRFKISPAYDINLQHAMREARNVWQAKHSPLTPIPVEIALKRNEQCYGRIHAEWWEVRRTALTKWKSGSLLTETVPDVVLAYAPIAEDCLTQIDTGTLYITGSRTLFVGQSRTVTIPYSKMVDIVQYRNGIKINKETGRSPYLISDKPLVIGALLNRMINLR